MTRKGGGLGQLMTNRISGRSCALQWLVVDSTHLLICLHMRRPSSRCWSPKRASLKLIFTPPYSIRSARPRVLRQHLPRCLIAPSAVRPTLASAAPELRRIRPRHIPVSISQREHCNFLFNTRLGRERWDHTCLPGKLPRRLRHRSCFVSCNVPRRTRHRLLTCTR